MYLIYEIFKKGVDVWQNQYNIVKEVAPIKINKFILKNTYINKIYFLT